MSNSDRSPRGRGTAGGRARGAQIERAAAEVLAELGYAGASVARIAERAGVSKGVVTYHFPSKDQLLRQVALRLLQGCAEHVASASGASRTPAARLRAEISAELEFFSPRRVEFLAMAEVLSNHREADFGRAFDEVAAGETEALAELLSEGQAAGQFRAFDATQVAQLIAAAKNDVLERWASDSSLELAPMAAALLDFVEAAVVAK